LNSKGNKSALKVNKGIEQPPQINEKLGKVNIRKNSIQTPEDYLKGILEGNRSVLSRAITLVESSLPAHHQIAQKVIELCVPNSGNSVRIAVTGVPGVGKSTFIEAFGKYLTSKGKKVAVLAIDPTSSRSKGSILGDKTRMEELAVDANAFIRPSPSTGSLGGVARKTRESLILCEAAGFNVILIETVGVGQSETAAHSMVDFFLLLMLAGAGDELQGIKRGIMEMADAVIINKADGENKIKAETAKTEYAGALKLFRKPPSGWEAKVNVCSALTKEGISEIWETIDDYCNLTKANGYFEKNRQEQSLHQMHDMIKEFLMLNFYNNNEIVILLNELENSIINNKTSSFIAAQMLIDRYKNISGF
jgi:LAO/AO transport system kinase